MTIWSVYVDIDGSLTTAQRGLAFAAIEADPRAPDDGCVGDEGSGEFVYLGVEADSAVQARDVALDVTRSALAAEGVTFALTPGEVFDPGGKVVLTLRER